MSWLIKPMTIHTHKTRTDRESERERENGKQKLCHCTPQMRYSQFVSGIVVWKILKVHTKTTMCIHTHPFREINRNG